MLHDSNGDGTTYTPGLSQHTGTTDRFAHSDWLGSTRYLSDATGNGIPNALRYDAFGGVVANAGGVHPTDFLFAGAWGYQSEYRSDTEPGLGLMYLEQRHYDPEVGRFISPDPIGFAGGLNLYAYCGNDPVNGVDPSGLGPVIYSDPELMSVPGVADVITGQRRGFGATAQSLGVVQTGMEVATPGAAFAGSVNRRDYVGAAACVVPIFGSLLRDVLAARRAARLLALMPRARVGMLADAALWVSGKVGRFSDVGGHHIFAKAAFEGATNYDLDKAFCISYEFIGGRGWNHPLMTAKQQALFAELARSGRANTLAEHTRIAVEALRAGGASAAEARGLVAQGLLDLRSSGVKGPTRIPWHGP